MKKGDLGWVWHHKDGPVLGLLLTDPDSIYGVADVLVDGVPKERIPVWSSREQIYKREPAASNEANVRYMREKLFAAVCVPPKYLLGEGE